MSAAQIMEELPRLSLTDVEAVRRRAEQVSAEKRRARCAISVDAKPGDAWQQELADLRRQIGTGQAGIPLQQLMDDLRSDR